MENTALILTLAAGFTAAVLFGYLTHRARLSPIVGYLLAGVLIGPQTPGFVADKHLAEQLAEVGVILLMFGVGLHLHLEDLIAVRKTAIIGGIGQIAITTSVGAVVAHTFGWAWPTSIVYGMSLAVASTVVLVRVLTDTGKLHSPVGRIAVGWLVVEDVCTVFGLVLLPVVVADAQTSPGVLVQAIVLAFVKLAAFAAIMFFVGPRFLPPILKKIAQTRSRELFTLAILAVALGIATISTYLFGISMALGAFLAGMVVGHSEFSARAAAEALPMRDAFAVMFFLSVGMLFDPAAAVSGVGMIFATTAIIVIGKPLAVFLITRLLGYQLRDAVRIAVSFGQIGEFSFLLASLGIQLKILPDAAMNPIVAGSILSITINPLVVRMLPAAIDRLLNKRRPRRKTAADAAPAARPSVRRAVVVGYGPIGQIVTRLLLDRGIEPSIIEMNIDTVHRLQEQNLSAVFGDFSQVEVRAQAGVDQAVSLILSSSGSVASLEAIRAVRLSNPNLHIVCRADFLREVPAFREAGADEIFTGEGEVALAVTDSILRDLGGTPEQLDEFRLQLRARLAEAPTSVPNVPGTA